MKTVTMKVSDLSQDPANARKHDEKNIDSIIASLRRFGQQKPIVIDASKVVRAGSGTLEAAKRIGWETIECVETSLKGSDAIAYAIADNRTAELAEWDSDILAAQLSGLLTDDEALANAAGFSAEEIEAMLSDLSDPAEIDEDEVPEPPVDPIAKLGDLWILGEHRLLCGDSTKAKDVTRLMAGVKADMMVTDPPYGVEYDADWRNQAKRPDGTAYGASAVGKVSNDDRADWRESWALFPGDIAYVWHAGCRSPEVAESLTVCGFVIRNLIVWAKNSMVIGRGDYHHQHEPCWYVVRKGCPGRRTDDRTQTTLWQIDKPQKSETGHSTQKPVECMARPMQNHEAKTIYDPFLGSGTTLIAAEQLGRKCYGMEISPQYCDVIVARWEKLTGQKAVLEEGGQ
jgi:DNA modification methylase